MSEPSGAPTTGTQDVLLIIGDGKIQNIPLDGRALRIGRGHDCEVRLDHRALSRHHALLQPGPPATVQDLESTNGTRIAGARRRGGPVHALDAGEAFHIGPFSFVIVRRSARRGSTTDGDPLEVYDPSPRGVSALIGEVARSGASVLILGETGVGKEVLASTIHALSNRPGALTRINCAALSESLLESELFGHEKGAFTGAAAQHVGLLEAAAGGTVFLDEVGELTPAIQAKLLRAVEHREVLRIGSTRPIAVDVRFLAATNRDLAAEVEAGRFRRDLFFRLDGVQLVIPPLRTRRGLIVPLALRFLDEARTRAGKLALRFGARALAALEAHDWPGNVRELKATIERAVLLSPGDEIDVPHLAFTRRAAAVPPRAAAPPATLAFAIAAPDPELSVAQCDERDAVLRALEDCAGNQTRAAKRLGISRGTLVARIGLYRIRRPRA